MKLTLYGSLKGSVNPPGDSELQAPMSINELADKIGLPASEIKLVMKKLKRFCLKLWNFLCGAEALSLIYHKK